MDFEAGEALRTILGRRDADKVPSELAKKIEKCFTDKTDEHTQLTALYETLQRKHCKFKTVLNSVVQFRFCYIVVYFL